MEKKQYAPIAASRFMIKLWTLRWRITKRIGNFFKLPIQLSWGIAYPELALLA